MHLRRPAFKSGHRKKSHHSSKNIVKVEITVLPYSFPHHWTINISIFVNNKYPPTEERTADVGKHTLEIAVGTEIP